GDEIDLGQRDIELLGGDLAQRRIGAGAEIDLAGIDRDRAARIDRQEGIDLGKHDRLGASCALRLRVRKRSKRKADHEGAAALEHVAARRDDVHGSLLVQAAPAARLTAATMRTCVPQRQRLLASAFLMSASEGFLLVVSSAADSMIMPLMQ